MKTLMKIKSRKFFIIAILGVILSLNVTDANAGDWLKEIKHNRRSNHGSPTGQCNSNGGNTVGAPLDGGIITILLGGAGVAYFARKRKKNNEQ